MPPNILLTVFDCVSSSMFIKRTLAIPFLYLIPLFDSCNSHTKFMKNKNIYIHWFFFKEYLSLGPLGKKIDEWNQS